MVILSIPVTNNNIYQLYTVYPVPTTDNVILVPSERYYLQGSIPVWSSVSCAKGIQYYICIDHSRHATTCNLTKSSGCDFASVKNNARIFQLLNNEHILFFSTSTEMLVQTCPGAQNILQISGPHIV